MFCIMHLMPHLTRAATQHQLWSNVVLTHAHPQTLAVTVKAIATLTRTAVDTCFAHNVTRHQYEASRGALVIIKTVRPEVTSVSIRTAAAIEVRFPGLERTVHTIAFRPGNQGNLAVGRAFFRTWAMKLSQVGAPLRVLWTGVRIMRPLDAGQCSRSAVTIFSELGLIMKGMMTVGASTTLTELVMFAT